ncbi:MAG: aminotransferase class I/II-fold pyridoxal phosphate-dependent enzyme [Pseudomonadales bacterium]|nr:aminotransferase class I/II-fold pyridoxal phosphate-dependent enzyme [Pseudomonadales bacterium]
MTAQLSRRGFLSGSAVVAGALAGAGAVVPVSRALAASTMGSGLAYGPAPGVAKLNANENPYGPSKKALEAMFEASSKGAYYVGDSVPRLLDMISERYGISPEYLSLSSGSSGVLTYLAVAKSKQGKILGPDLFWDTTTKAALRQGGEMKRIARTKDLSIDLDALYAAITPDVSMVQICNPNNPTGMVIPADELRKFCIKASKKCTVLVDEAYNEITDDPGANSMVSLVKEGYDVYVARTFSKIYGLAGMRVGYMIASPENTQLLQTYGLGNYAMNQAGVAAAVETYDDFEFLNYSKAKIQEARGIILDAVKKNGLKAAPSETSFVFVDLGKLNAEKFRQEMASHQVLIRGIYQDYTHWSRVSCGLIPDVKQYAAALPKVLEAMKA